MKIEYLRKIFGSTDIYIITGFGEEKIYKKIASKKYVKIISNAEYENKNYGYAMKIFMQEMADKLDNYYAPKYESGIVYNDPIVKIKWPKKRLSISKKDKNLKTFQEFRKSFKFL